MITLHEHFDCKLHWEGYLRSLLRNQRHMPVCIDGQANAKYALK